MHCSVDVHIIRSCLIILCSAHLISAYNILQPQNVSRSLTRHRRQAACPPGKFKCQSGTCIDEINECDGKTDCPDGSDETVHCKEIIPCNNPNLFRCTYGACIDRTLACNGKQDCKDNSDETSSLCKNRPDPATSTCGVGKFDCDSGQCITDDLLCDGKADCPEDNSDETLQVCGNIQCPKLTYRCRYGACVTVDAKCNGFKDCDDGSDEEGCDNVTPVTPPTEKPPVRPKPTDGSCEFPNNPPVGEYLIGAAPAGTYQPGDYVPPFSVLRVDCGRRHKPSPPIKGYPVCLNGKWNPTPPTCARACRSIYSTKTTTVKCKFFNTPLDSCEDPIEGTIASITCENYFENPSSISPTRVCREGSWDYPITQCLPVCGIKTPKGTPNIINGTIVKRGDYPWHVGIYFSQNQQHICGGSLLNPKVVLSAAHCFTDLEGKPYPKENYLLAAGKYYRNYNDDRDDKVQYSTIESLHVPLRYRGIEASYAEDIAVIVLTKILTISMTVQPVCVDWSNDFEYQQLSENNAGVVVGWGYTKVGEAPSQELKELSVPYVSYDRCYDQVPKDFRKYLTYDKVCAGFLDKGTSVCQGDSGGGLTFARHDDRYFIRGVVSTSPRSEDSCDPNQYATYTLLSRHIEFIKDIETRNRPS